MRHSSVVNEVMFGLLVLSVGCATADSRDEGMEDTDAQGDESGDDGQATDDPTTGADGGQDGAGDDGAGDDGASDDGASDGADGGPPVDPETGGMLFTLSNAADGNAVVMFARDDAGMLEQIGEFITGGNGSGGGLGSQGAIATDDDFVYVVNAGDGTISSMAIYEDHIGLVDQISTGGAMPTSLAVGDGRLYVLNAEGAGSVMGFSVTDGVFAELAGASQPLSGAESPAPAQVGLSPDGSALVVTERATNQIVTYAVADDGSLSAPVVNPSEGMTPFGFDFTTSSAFVVSEAFGGGMNPGASAASSYRVADGGALWTYTASEPSGQTAACWLEIVGDRFAYTTNTASNTVSAYTLDDEGAIDLFPGSGVVVDLGDDHSPLDMAVSADEKYLYVLNGVADNIMGFQIGDDGSLTELPTTVDIPETAVGLAGF